MYDWLLGIAIGMRAGQNFYPLTDSCLGFNMDTSGRMQKALFPNLCILLNDHLVFVIIFQNSLMLCINMIADFNIFGVKYQGLIFDDHVGFNL